MLRRSRPDMESGKRAKRPTTPRFRHLALPERALVPIAGTALLLCVWAGVAHASGSGWVQTVGAVVAGLLLLGLVAPAFVAPGLTVICEMSSTDAVAGSPVELEIVGNRAMRCVPRSTSGGPLLLTRHVPARLVIVPPRRGVISTITLRLGTAAPFGLLWWSRDQILELPRPLYVAPKARAHSAAVRETPSLKEGSRTPRPTLSGDLRGVRPYQHGDGRRRVHWHASAHTGDLMVRESEMRTDDPVLAQMNAGRTVVLETTEPTRRVVAPVTDRLTAGRRLARAVGPSDGP